MLFSVCALHTSCGAGMGHLPTTAHPTSPSHHPDRHARGSSCSLSPGLTSLVLWRHLASMSYLSSSTTSTWACRSLHRSWGSRTGRQERGSGVGGEPLSLRPPFAASKPGALSPRLSPSPAGRAVPWEDAAGPFSLRFWATGSSTHNPCFPS